MIRLLIQGAAILAAGNLLDDGDNIRSYDASGKEDAIYPKHVIEGWQIVDADVPDGFTCAGYTWDGTAVQVKPPVVVMPTEADYDAALEAMYDAKAKEQRFDNRLTCSIRAGYPGPYQAQGIAFGTWMDDCNALAYQVMAQVLGGQRAQPTIDELLAMMPAMVWP